MERVDRMEQTQPSTSWAENTIITEKLKKVNIFSLRVLSWHSR
jgi:hypothetical protein